jgi:hypothetical protein
MESNKSWIVTCITDRIVTAPAARVTKKPLPPFLNIYSNITIHDLLQN